MNGTIRGSVTRGWPRALRVIAFLGLAVPVPGAHAAETVAVELELTEGGNNYDDPCFWQDPVDQTRVLSCITSKEDGQVECFTLPAGAFFGAAKGFKGKANNCDVDAVRNEMATTDNAREPGVLIHSMPSLELLRKFGDDIDTPNGVCVGHEDGKSLVFVTDQGADDVIVFDSVTGDELRRWEYELKKAEGIACDDDLQRVYVCDDESDARGCKAFTYGGEPVGDEFGISETGSDAEGVTLYRCGSGDGYIVVSDQVNNEYDVFDRQPPFAHRCSFELVAGSDLTDDTDGIDVIQSAAYPGGLFGACDHCNGSKDELDLASWERIAEACGLEVCPLGKVPGSTAAR